MHNVQGLASKQGGNWAPGPCCPFRAPAGPAALDGVGVPCLSAVGDWERDIAWERLGNLGLEALPARHSSQQVTSLTGELEYRLIADDKTIKP